MEYILLTAFLGCAIAALGARIVLAIMVALPVAFVLTFLAFNSPLSPWCNPEVARCPSKAASWHYDPIVAPAPR